MKRTMIAAALLMAVFMQGCPGGGKGGFPEGATTSGGTTAAVEDLAVTSVTPTVDAKDVEVTTSVAATFNRAIDPATAKDAFTLAGPWGQVNGTVAYDSSTTTATFKPTYPLKNWTAYTATITESVTAADVSTNTSSKNNLQKPYTWKFTAIGRPILYTSNRLVNQTDGVEVTGDLNIWKVDINGVNLPLTKLQGEDMYAAQPQWSPDGTRLAFWSDMDPNVTLDSSNSIDFTKPIIQNQGMNLWVMDADGKNPRALTKLTTDTNYKDFLNALAVYDFRPQWSQDGSTILFESIQDITGADKVSIKKVINIWKVDANVPAAKPVCLTKLDSVDAVFHFWPRWADSDTAVVFFSNRDPQGAKKLEPKNSWNIFKIKADGTNLTAFTTLSKDNSLALMPEISPDQNTIAYVSTGDLGSIPNPLTITNIWSMDATGKNQQPLTKLTNKDIYSGVFYLYWSQLRWSQDSSKLIYISTRSLDPTQDEANTNKAPNVWMTASDGSSSTPLTGFKGNSFVLWPDMMQNSAKILFVSNRDLNDPSLAGSAMNVWLMDANGDHMTHLSDLKANGVWMYSPTF